MDLQIGHNGLNAVYDYEFLRDTELLKNKLERIDWEQSLAVLEYAVGRYERSEISRFAAAPLTQLVGLTVYCYDAQLRDRSLKCIRVISNGSMPSSNNLMTYFKDCGCRDIAGMQLTTHYLLIEFVDHYSSRRVLAQANHTINGLDILVTPHIIGGVVIPESRINMVPAPRVDSLRILRQRLADLDPRDGTLHFLRIQTTYPEIVAELAAAGFQDFIELLRGIGIHL